MARISGAVYQYLAREYGGICRERETLTAVGAARVLIMGHDPERVSVTFINEGATTIALSPNQQVTAARGIRLIPNGGAVSINVKEDAILSALPWYAFGDGADGSLYTIETRREAEIAETEG